MVQYEGINSLCFFCGRVGHRMEGCPYTTKAPETKDDDATPEKKEDDTVESDNSAEKEDMPAHGETYGPWVLVSRKKKVSRKEKKDPAQPPSFSSVSLRRAQPASFVKSPSPFRAASPKPSDKDLKQIPRVSQAEIALVADHTILAKGKHVSAPIHTRSKNRVSQLNQRSQGAAEWKGNRKNFFSQGDRPKHDQNF